MKTYFINTHIVSFDNLIFCCCCCVHWSFFFFFISPIFSFNSFWFWVSVTEHINGSLWRFFSFFSTLSFICILFNHFAKKKAMFVVINGWCGVLVISILFFFFVACGEIHFKFYVISLWLIGYNYICRQIFTSSARYSENRIKVILSWKCDFMQKRIFCAWKKRKNRQFCAVLK